MNPSYQQLLNTARSKRKENKKLLSKLKKWKPKDLDRAIHDLHAEAFAFIDCLDCANCCKSISPAVQNNDVDRIAQFLKVKPSQLVSDFMHLDEEGDYVMNTSPCPFLQGDNCCSVYDARPNACKGYPHTDRNKMHQILELTLKNTAICPAVCYVFEELKKRM